MVQNIRPGIQLFFEVGESLPVVGILPGNIICVKSNIFDTITYNVVVCSLFPPFTDSLWQFSCIFVPFLHLSCFICLFGLFVMEFFSFREMFSFPSMLACFCFLLSFLSRFSFCRYLSLHVGVFLFFCCHFCLDLFFCSPPLPPCWTALLFCQTPVHSEHRWKDLGSRKYWRKKIANKWMFFAVMFKCFDKKKRLQKVKVKHLELPASKVKLISLKTYQF